MLAVLPGGPSTLYLTTFGLNWTILIPAPALALRSCEPNTLCSRDTTRPETARTTTRSNGIHHRLSKPPIEIARTRSPPAGPSDPFRPPPSAYLLCRKSRGPSAPPLPAEPSLG